MRWLKKDRSSEVWESAADHPNGDIGKAHKIRTICASAESIADAMSVLRGQKAEARKAFEGERYQAAAENPRRSTPQDQKEPGQARPGPSCGAGPQRKVDPLGRPLFGAG
jgi:hypothetical protein